MNSRPETPGAAFKRNLLNEACRRSLLHFHRRAFETLHPHEPFVMAPYVDAMCHALENVEAGLSRQLVITIPPRHGKSELTSGSFVAWALGRDPTGSFMIASYGLDLSTRLSGFARTIMKAPWYKEVFPETVLKIGRDAAGDYATTKGGEVRATSTDGATTGFGARKIIIDDPHKADEALTLVGRERTERFYRNTLRSRFNNPARASLILVQQRLHEHDLAGIMLGHGGCDHLNLPAIAEEDTAIPLTRGRIWQRKKGEVLDPVRIPLVFLEEQRLAMGFRGFGAQFQQNPTVADGGQIDLAWFGQHDNILPRRSYHRIVQSWDTAATDRQHADFSVGLTWGWREDRWHLLDVVRAQLRFVALRERVIAWHRQWQADALIIENASTGLALYDEVKQAALPGLLRCPTPRGSKLDRLAGRTAQLATGAFLLPTSAPWLQAFRNELTAFPDGRNDDQVDALVQFLEFVGNEDRWVRTRYNADGRPVRPSRPDRRPRYYDGDAPSGASWS